MIQRFPTDSPLPPAMLPFLRKTRPSRNRASSIFGLDFFSPSPCQYTETYDIFQRNMSNPSFENAIRLIDQANREDPNLERWEGVDYPKELLYSERMTAWLEKLKPDASDLLKIAARAQHICRWMIPRSLYPKTRVGYLEWRTRLYSFHAEKAAAIMAQCGYDDPSIKAVKRILKKRGLKKDPASQAIEDVACLVFLESYFSEFVNDYGDEEKIISIVQKTWSKMSAEAQEATLNMKLSENAGRLIQKALAEA
jgi:Domain of unknown function (DUF4202)